MTLDDIDTRVGSNFLDIVGVCSTQDSDALGDGSIVLLGPKEPGFWAHFTASPEYNDQSADPIDRWSTRTISQAADDLGATPLFPFGAPARPFLSWALRSGRAWSSPVGMLVHDRFGLWLSFRGALFVEQKLDASPAQPRPCDACADQPCRTACPVSALTSDGYNLDVCHTFLDTADGDACMTRGCAVRRACPAGADYRRVDAQSAYHMKRFHPCR